MRLLPMDRALLLPLLSLGIAGGAFAQDGGPADEDDFLNNDDLEDLEDLIIDDDDDDDREASVFVTRLTGLQEVPSISTSGSGAFRAELDEGAGMMTYRLTYENLEGIQQAHIHLGRVLTNGGISVFLCTNLENGPADVQECPQAPAEITGTVMAAQVIGPAEQGIAETELDALVRAMRAAATYVNVHTEAFPAGEIRGQLVPADGDDGSGDDFDDYTNY